MIEINNWKEYYLVEKEFGDTLIYVSIKPDEVIKYIMTLLNGKRDAYIGFYKKVGDENLLLLYFN
ncbi:hypothetical protein NGI46_17365 [Peribacillus butanolivorans]|uniref:hypothetical protein n=1 Tax=Peribacillus butanolivorans TaxID=421767 RepID=UPI00207CE9AC|nr:hypothetical protein [Peribacillus butanolivorans]MCO0599182.1 hypothetical protein [Peribacillus butanolivorans]